MLRARILPAVSRVEDEAVGDRGGRFSTVFSLFRVIYEKLLYDCYLFITTERCARGGGGRKMGCRVPFRNLPVYFFVCVIGVLVTA